MAYADVIKGTPGLVSYWRLGAYSSSKAAADEQGANPGTYYNAVSRGVAGAIVGDADTAARMNGGFLTVPNSASLNVGDVFSLECWVKLAASGAIQTLFASPSPAPWLFVYTDNIVYLQHVSAGVNSVVSNTTVTPDGRWHHIVVTKNGAANAIYIDGVNRTGAVTNVTFGNPPSQLVLAMYHDGANYPLQGSLDEVAIYNVALTAAQVSAHYAATGAAYATGVKGTTGLVSYWRLGEPPTARDEKSANPGELINAPASVAGFPYADPNTGLSFNGTSHYARIPHSASLNLGDVYTLECWVKRGASGVTHALIGKDGSFGVFVYSNNFVYLQNDTDVASAAYSTITLTADGLWHHVVATKNGSGATGRVYIDGVDRTTGVAAVTTANSTSDVTLGAYEGANQYWLGGSLDEVAVYNVALTAAQVSAHYRAAQPQISAYVVGGGNVAANLSRFTPPLMQATLTSAGDLTAEMTVRAYLAADLAAAGSVSADLTIYDIARAWFRLPPGIRSSIQFPGAAGESFVIDGTLGEWVQNDRRLGEFRELMALIGVTEDARVGWYAER